LKPLGITLPKAYFSKEKVASGSAIGGDSAFASRLEKPVEYPILKARKYLLLPKGV
jgi:hypothetical protein